MSTWLRRSISISVAIMTFMLNVPCFPALFSILLIYDLLRDRRLPRIRAYLLFSFYLFWELFGLVSSFAVWVFSPLCAGDRERYLAWNHALQRVWARGFAGAGIRLLSLKLDISGNTDFRRKPVLLLARHSSLADTILLAWFILVLHRMRMRYVMKKELLWEPCLDIVGNRVPNCFIDRHSRQSREEVAKIAALAKQLGPGEGIVLYPEGTRFTEEKRRRTLKKLAERECAELAAIAGEYRHVLPPHTAGALALLEHAPDADVVFFTHSGFENTISFAAIFRGDLIGNTIRVRYRTIAADRVPEDLAARKRWLFLEWRQVDETTDRLMQQAS
jgi:1-acyl-sn-glycerol-3-phosphate acyltransferase